MSAIFIVVFLVYFLRELSPSIIIGLLAVLATILYQLLKYKASRDWFKQRLCRNLPYMTDFIAPDAAHENLSLPQRVYVKYFNQIQRLVTTINSLNKATAAQVGINLPVNNEVLSDAMVETHGTAALLAIKYRYLSRIYTQHLPFDETKKRSTLRPIVIADGNIVRHYNEHNPATPFVPTAEYLGVDSIQMMDETDDL